MQASNFPSLQPKNVMKENSSLIGVHFFNRRNEKIVYEVTPRDKEMENLTVLYSCSQKPLQEEF
jgi:hypothetical protein